MPSTMWQALTAMVSILMAFIETKPLLEFSSQRMKPLRGRRMTEMTNEDALIEQIAELKKQNTVLKKINHALMERVENHGNQFAPYAAFENSVYLAEQVRKKTLKLNNTLAELERSNRALTVANNKANTFKQRFTDAIESMSVAFVLLDCDGRIILQNSKFSSFA